MILSQLILIYVLKEEKSIFKISNRNHYMKDIFKISSTPTAQKKYNEAFNTHTSQLDWEKIYLLPFKTTLDTKLREFKNKILNRILYTNEMLFRFKKVDSPLCDFCENELETVEHLFFFCTKVNISVSLEIKDVLFGILDTSNINILVNYIVLESKNTLFTLGIKTFQTEGFVARKNDKLDFHSKKGKPLLPIGYFVFLYSPRSLYSN